MFTNRALFVVNFFCFLVLLSVPNILSAQVSTSLHQTFNASDAQSISIKVNSPNLEVKYTQGTRILIETKISLPINNSALLDFIAQKGRYDLITELDPNTKCLKLLPKGTQDLILIKGKALEENIAYTIYIPKRMAFVDFANK